MISHTQVLFFGRCRIDSPLLTHPTKVTSIQEPSTSFTHGHALEKMPVESSLHRQPPSPKSATSEKSSYRAQSESDSKSPQQPQPIPAPQATMPTSSSHHKKEHPPRSEKAQKQSPSMSFPSHADPDQSYPKPIHTAPIAHAPNPTINTSPKRQGSNHSPLKTSLSLLLCHLVSYLIPTEPHAPKPKHTSPIPNAKILFEPTPVFQPTHQPVV